MSVLENITAEEAAAKQDDLRRNFSQAPLVERIAASLSGYDGFVLNDCHSADDYRIRAMYIGRANHVLYQITRYAMEHGWSATASDMLRAIVEQQQPVKIGVDVL